MGSRAAARLPNQRPVRIDLRGFDALITTCPLNIKPRNLPTFVQTIHDLIPLEYVAHNEDPLMFSHRLQACIQARRLFVSQSTANKYKAHIHYTHQEARQHLLRHNLDQDHSVHEHCGPDLSYAAIDVVEPPGECSECGLYICWLCFAKQTVFGLGCTPAGDG